MFARGRAISGGILAQTGHEALLTKMKNCEFLPIALHVNWRARMLWNSAAKNSYGANQAYRHQLDGKLHSSLPRVTEWAISIVPGWEANRAGARLHSAFWCNVPESGLHLMMCALHLSPSGTGRGADQHASARARTGTMAVRAVLDPRCRAHDTICFETMNLHRHNDDKRGWETCR
jgi:hypothetical protein